MSLPYPRQAFSLCVFASSFPFGQFRAAFGGLHATPSAARAGGLLHGTAQEVTQFDFTDNHPLKSWNACSETIHQHPSPPISITFIDEESGQQVHFVGTYKIGTYQPAPTP